MSYSIYIGRLPSGRWKVGCDKDYPNRPNEQGMRLYTMIEQHDCIDTASDRELELQDYYKSYGVVRDKISYKESIERRRLGGKKGGKASVYGRPSPNRKLDDYKVEYIRTQYNRGKDAFGKKITYRRLAKDFQVSYSTIQNILNGKHYG